jgi:hypothetical protein
MSVNRLSRKSFRGFPQQHRPSARVRILSHFNPRRMFHIFLGPILYCIFPADLPEFEQTLTATYVDDTAILVSHQNPITASRLLQNHLNRLEQRLKRWRIKAKVNKSPQVTFTLKWGYCPAVTLYGKPIIQDETVKYLGIHLDRKWTWQTQYLQKSNSWLWNSNACTES